MTSPTPRQLVLLMAARLDGFGVAPDDDEAIRSWQPEHQHPEGTGDPECAACWIADYDRAVAKTHPEPAYRAEFDQLSYTDLHARLTGVNAYRAALTKEYERQSIEMLHVLAGKGSPAT